ncbi:hypothetical protein KPATCC21470_3864 [Kitasatospora purpeofusca]
MGRADHPCGWSARLFAFPAPSGRFPTGAGPPFRAAAPVAAGPRTAGRRPSGGRSPARPGPVPGGSPAGRGGVADRALGTVGADGYGDRCHRLRPRPRHL